METKGEIREHEMKDAGRMLWKQHLDCGDHSGYGLIKIPGANLILSVLVLNSVVRVYRGD